MGANFNQQLNSFINQQPLNQQENIQKQIQDNLGQLQVQVQQENFRLSSFLQNLFAANGNYANNMWGGEPMRIYNGNEVANGNVQVQANDHIENNNRDRIDDKKSPVIVLLSQDEIRKWYNKSVKKCMLIY